MMTNVMTLWYCIFYSVLEEQQADLIIFPSPSGPLGEGCHTYILPFRGDDDDDDYGDVQMINDHDYIGDMRMKKMFTMMSFGKAVT